MREQCDALDGAVDGLVSAPRRCRPDLTALPACEEGGADAAVCFTAEERRVLERWYAGAADSAGEPLYPGMPPGSERFWQVWFLDAGGRVAPGNALGRDYPKYLGLPGELPADWDVAEFDFDRDPDRLRASADLLNATDPDLRAFRAAGGKLLMWHGWADPLVLPDQSVDYYERVAALVGGTDEAGEFFRLYMMPGHGHCWEIPAGAPDRFNPIRVLEDWVERDRVPRDIPVTAVEGREARVPEGVLCPYPDRAVAGRGGQCRDSVASP
ncbi:MAG: tannase/feruloyl esterase family alpha/beta hydrolase [Gammaproteobacteria bacterium]